MINKHALVDRFSLAATVLITGRKKYFSASLEAHSFEEHFHKIGLNVPELMQEGIYELKVSTFSNDVHPAIKIVQWLGFDYPSVIYHHGSNEAPLDLSRNAKNTFFQIFLNWPRRIPANLILIKAPYHLGKLKPFLDKMTDLNNFMIMLSVPVCITEWIIRQYRRRSREAILVAGLGQGGWITNLHRAFFNSAQAYIPIMAGAKLDELFLSSSYRYLCGKLAKEHPKVIEAKLSFFSRFRSITTSNLFPLLARHDQYVDYYVQKPAYNGFPLRTIDTGHVTGTLRPSLSREHILEVLEMHS